MDVGHGFIQAVLLKCLFEAVQKIIKKTRWRCFASGVIVRGVTQ